MKVITCIAAILLMILSANAQMLSPLSIGDKVPPVSFGMVLNDARPRTTLANFKNKLVILDFMNTYCSSCIKALPAFDKLSKKYQGSLEIFMVTSEGEERGKKFMSTNPFARAVQLPFIVRDSSLIKLFPHTFVSHEAWIYDGTVVAITAADYVTAENIETILHGITPSWEVKYDVGSYDYSQSLWQLNKVAKQYAVHNNSFGSIFMPHLNGVAVRCIDEVDSVNGVRTIRAINLSGAELYQNLITHGNTYPKSHILVDPDYANRLIFPGTGFRDAWDEANTYCYEASFAAGTSRDVIDKKIQADLDTYVKVKSIFKTTTTSCYEVSMDTGATRPAQQQSYDSLYAMASKDDLVFLSAAHLVHQLNEVYWGTPFYNDISVPDSNPILLPVEVLSDIAVLKKELIKQHIVLREVLRDTNMLFLIKP